MLLGPHEVLTCGHAEVGVPDGAAARPQHEDDPGQLRPGGLGAGHDRARTEPGEPRRLLQAPGGELVTIAQRLAELGITLPPVTAPLASYVPAVRTGDLVYSS